MSVIARDPSSPRLRRGKGARGAEALASAASQAGDENIRAHLHRDTPETRTLYLWTVSLRTTIPTTVPEIGWLGTGPSVQTKPPNGLSLPKTGAVS
jgi:hypothetical protein